MEVIYDNPDEGNADNSEPESLQQQQNSLTEQQKQDQQHQHQHQIQHQQKSQPNHHHPLPKYQNSLKTSPQHHNSSGLQKQKSTTTSSDTRRRSTRTPPNASPRHQPPNTSPRHLPSLPSSAPAEGNATSSRRWRSQSCSSPPPPLPPPSKGGSPRPVEASQRGMTSPRQLDGEMTSPMTSPRQLDAPSSVTSVASSRGSAASTHRTHRTGSSVGGRRLSLATLEAARLAVAARAAYARHRPSRAIEKAAFFIVTSEGEQRLDYHEMEELLSRASQRSLGRGHRRRSGSRQSVESRAASRLSGGAGSEAEDQGGRRSPQANPSVSSGSYNNSPKRGARRKRFSSSVGSTDALSVRSGVASHAAAKEHFQKVRFNSFSHGSAADIKSMKSAATSLADLKEQRVGKFGHDAATDKPSVIKFAIAGVVMLAGTCAFLLSYAFGRGGVWTIAGSTVMGIGSLCLVLGLCWYLSRTTADGGEGTGRLEIRVVDDTQLARLVKTGARVQTVTLQTC